MFIRIIASITWLFFCLPFKTHAQNIERVVFDKEDSTDSYYLAVAPQSKQIKGVVVLLTSFTAPENLLPETKLHNVGYANDFLIVFAPMKQKLYADSATLLRINAMLRDIVKRFKADTSRFALAGYDEAGAIALRYTELAYQHPSQHALQPKAVFCIDSPVDLFGLWHWSERQIKKNYWPGAVGDAHYYLDAMTKENGPIYTNKERYIELSPFYNESDSLGNEQYLKNVAVRLYYDTDIAWQLKNRRNSFYDTKMPEASELIKRLLLLGNDRAEFMASAQPGMRSNGTRHPNALSIVDEVACVGWLKRSLGIFDVNTWTPPYTLDVPKGWNVERFSLPPDFAPQMSYKGIEDIRFAPGWEDSTSEAHWSYAYLWWLDGTLQIAETGLQTNLQAYYNGLVGRNVSSRKIPANGQVPTTVQIKKVKTGAGDVQTFKGTIHMLDYMALKPMVLNTVIHVIRCENKGHTALFVELSPKPVTHAVWKKFDQMANNFNCNRSGK